MACRYTVEDVISCIDVPTFEDDDSMSEDEFDGYFEDSESENEENGSGEDEGDCNTNASTHAGMIPDYSLEPGCTANTDGLTPIEFFTMMVDEHMFDHIVAQTILYAEQYMATATLRPHPRVHRWGKVEFTRNELKKFIALIIVMGLVNYPSLEDHWATTWPFASHSVSQVSTANQKTFM